MMGGTLDNVRTARISTVTVAEIEPETKGEPVTLEVTVTFPDVLGCIRVYGDVNCGIVYVIGCDGTTQADGPTERTIYKSRHYTAARWAANEALLKFKRSEWGLIDY